MEGLKVEVCCGNGTYYRAFVTDVFNDGVSVAFENKWKPESKFPFSQVFLPWTEVQSSAEYAENQEVEVFTNLEENEASGWWKAVIKIKKGDFYAVEYGLGNAYMKVSVVSSNQLRLANNNPPIDHNTFYKFEIEVPEELREHAKMDNAHKEFQKCIKAEICRYSPDSGVLIVISRNEQSRQLSEMLREMHFHNLGEKVSLLKIIDEHQASIKLLQGNTKMIEEGEKLLQEKKHILSLAECPVCSDYMAAPIFQCNVGHSICKECKNKLVKCPSCSSAFNSTRNFSLEKIIENISFPCSNAKFGCKDMILLKHKVEHSECCEYRLYDCLPGKNRGCTWKGKKQDILSHMKQEHKKLIRKGKSNNMHDNFSVFSTTKWMCDLICAHGEIFWLQRHMDAEEQTYYISVHYVGPRENCEKYVYTLSFISPSDPQKNIKFSMRTHPDRVETTKEIKTMECFSIKQCLANRFAIWGVLCYGIEIIKIL